MILWNNINVNKKLEKNPELIEMAAVRHTHEWEKLTVAWMAQLSELLS